MLIVLDTIVLISGLLKINSKPAKVLDLVVAAKAQVAFDREILSLNHAAGEMTGCRGKNHLSAIMIAAEDID